MRHLFYASPPLCSSPKLGTLVRKRKEQRMRRIRGRWGGGHNIELWLLRVACLLYSWPHSWCGNTHRSAQDWTCKYLAVELGRVGLHVSLRMCRQLIIDGGKAFSSWMLLWAILMKLIMSPNIKKKAQKKKRGKLGRGRERANEGGEVVCVWIRNSLWNIMQSITVYT